MVTVSGGSGAIALLAGPTIPGNEVKIVADPFGVFTTNPASTTASVAIYWSNANSQFELKNLTSSAYVFRFNLLGTTDA